MDWVNNSLYGMSARKRILVSTGLIAGALVLVAGLAMPISASSFIFATGAPDGKLGALSRRPSPGKIETETADDFLLQEPTVISKATIFGLLPVGTPLADIKNVEVEVYHIFSTDSDEGRTSGSPTFSTSAVPTRVNSPSDVEISTATRER